MNIFSVKRGVHPAFCCEIIKELISPVQFFQGPSSLALISRTKVPKRIVQRARMRSKTNSAKMFLCNQMSHSFTNEFPRIKVTVVMCNPKDITNVSSKTKGPGEKGPPRDHPEFRLRNSPISSADFPMTPLEGTEHHFGLFRRSICGNIRQPLVLPAPFVLLLTMAISGKARGGHCTSANLRSSARCISALAPSLTKEPRNSPAEAHHAKSLQHSRGGSHTEGEAANSATPFEEHPPIFEDVSFSKYSKAFEERTKGSMSQETAQKKRRFVSITLARSQTRKRR